MSRLSQAGGCDIPNSGRSKEDARKDDNIKIAALDGFHIELLVFAAGFNTGLFGLNKHRQLVTAGGAAELFNTGFLQV